MDDYKGYIVIFNSHNNVEHTITLEQLYQLFKARYDEEKFGLKDRVMTKFEGRE